MNYSRKYFYLSEYQFCFRSQNVGVLKEYMYFSNFRTLR